MKVVLLSRIKYYDKGRKPKQCFAAVHVEVLTHQTGLTQNQPSFAIAESTKDRKISWEKTIIFILQQTPIFLHRFQSFLPSV